MTVDLFAPRGRYGTYPSIADRIDASGDCWEWTGAKSSGYGEVGKVGGTKWVHRIVYEALVGPIPDGLTLDHLCRNRACCNPDHLEPVTMAENIRRGRGPVAGGKANAAKDALMTHCKQGHPYTYVYTHPRTGHRSCKVCRDISLRRHAERRRHG